jgi:hypothetical protein
MVAEGVEGEKTLTFGPKSGVCAKAADARMAMEPMARTSLVGESMHRHDTAEDKRLSWSISTVDRLALYPSPRVLFDPKS